MKVIMIKIPGIVRYGAYQAFPADLAFLTSERNQLPRKNAATRIGIAFRMDIAGNMLLWWDQEDALGSNAILNVI